MSHLLPNIQDLIAALPDSKAAAEARELADAAKTAETMQGLDAALAGVVDGWLKE
ncbi:hypothetical protein GCM10025867_05010 [Frondihabitans sucicola]|uniref:Uncharacterized protein n=1 Tax=Frondihabitans sucicola TaxID=1268041 RepID=A0ABM8GIP3_9MICO|nr:hypothetical protein [Frondihabitans sucicola]BDZ48260.1 hypothetical protein GCM10025867_05010 [Frondihabitans sucicola]